MIKSIEALDAELNDIADKLTSLEEEYNNLLIEYERRVGKKWEEDL